MLRAFRELTTRQKWIMLLLLVSGYISPVIGLVVYLFARKKTQLVLLRNASLIGSALAIVVYIANYVYLMGLQAAG